MLDDGHSLAVLLEHDNIRAHTKTKRISRFWSAIDVDAERGESNAKLKPKYNYSSNGREYSERQWLQHSKAHRRTHDDRVRAAYSFSQPLATLCSKSR